MPDVKTKRLRCDLAEILYEARQDAELSQIDLAQIVGVSQGTVSRWETGDQLPRLVYLRRLARALDLELCDLNDAYLAAGA